MLRTIGQVQSKTLEELRKYCISLIPLMQSDVSRYAPGRKRMWLFHEVNLKTGQVTKSYFDQRLYDFCQKVYPGCNIGLISFAGQVNNISSTGLISLHRDHSYALPMARTVNLGRCIFSYDLNRQSGNLKNYQLEDGQIIEFNCKHLHAVSTVNSDLRIAINLWQLNEDKGYKPLF